MSFYCVASGCLGTHIFALFTLSETELVLVPLLEFAGTGEGTSSDKLTLTNCLNSAMITLREGVERAIPDP